MHELGVAQGIVDVVRQYVPAPEEHAVRRVRVRVGELSGVLAEALAFCFGSVVAGTPMASAALVLERVPATCACRACGRETSGAALVGACPACGSTTLALIRGGELQVVDVEMDEPEPLTP